MYAGFACGHFGKMAGRTSGKNSRLSKYIQQSVPRGIFVLLTIGYVNPVFSPSEDIVNSSYTVELDYLKAHGDTYKYGLGSHWKSLPITAATNAEYVICSGRIAEDALVCSKTDGFYADGEIISISLCLISTVR